MTNVTELWKPLYQFDGYEISNLGNFRSLEREVRIQRGKTISTRKMPGRMLLKKTDGKTINLYVIIHLGPINGKKRIRSVPVQKSMRDHWEEADS